MYRLTIYFQRLFEEVGRQCYHIKVTFDQIFHRNLLPYLGKYLKCLSYAVVCVDEEGYFGGIEELYSSFAA